MAQPSSGDLLDHLGPWTEQEFLGLPEDRRIELLDGELLVSPSARRPHQRLSLRLAIALDSAATPGYEVSEAINVRVAPGRILIPDIVVSTDPGAEDVVAEASAVAMVVEIVSPGSVAADRAIKPPLYAAAGIGHYLRVELGSSGVAAAAYRLADGRYVEAARVLPGERLVLTEPFPVELDLSRLATTTRPDA
jgi:Uma2 family endonuclease